MKYRLYGREGVSAHEFGRLIEWGVVKPRVAEWGAAPKVKRVRVKKKVLKKRKDPHSGVEIEVKSEKSGS